MPLSKLRVQIDAIDDQLIKLLNERAELVHQVGEVKKKDGLEIYAPEREEKLLQALVAKSKGRLPEKSIRAIYREVMSAALALEQDLGIAYLGPEAPGPTKRRSASSAPACVMCHRPASPMCSMKSLVVARITASCQSRTPPKEPSTTPSIGTTP